MQKRRGEEMKSKIDYTKSPKEIGKQMGEATAKKLRLKLNLPSDTSGIGLITAERLRQIEVEGWTAKHDDEHERGELASAAICFASPFQPFVLDHRTQPDEYKFVDAYPPSWDIKWDKRLRSHAGYGDVVENQDLPINERIRNLVKAGALIAAEIDRLQRIKE